MSPRSFQLANGAFSLSAIEIQRLVSAASNCRDRTMVLLFSDTGMRRFEATSIQWVDIDFERRLLTVRRGKGGKHRVIPMTLRLSLELQKLSRQTSGEFVFQSRQATSLSLRQANRIVSQVGVRARIRHPNPRYRDITCHLLRHTFARLWKSQNGSIESLSYVLGHASPSLTLNVYGKESFPEVQKNYEKTLKQIFGRE